MAVPRGETRYAAFYYPWFTSGIGGNGHPTSADAYLRSVFAADDVRETRVCREVGAKDGQGAHVHGVPNGSTADRRTNHGGSVRRWLCTVCSKSSGTQRTPPLSAA